MTSSLMANTFMTHSNDYMIYLVTRQFISIETIYHLSPQEIEFATRERLCDKLGRLDTDL